VETGGSVVPKKQQEILDAFLGFLAGFKLASMGNDDGVPPECPDQFLWNLYSQMERTGKLPEAGGLLDQPYMLMVELASVSDAVEIQRPKPQPNMT